MGHWYTTEKTPDAVAAGEPRHFQPLKKPAKDGRTTTDTTLRHAKAQFLAPSVSAITDFRAKHQLTAWKLKQYRAAHEAVFAATGRIDEVDVKAEMERLTLTARDRGTELHSLINRAFDKDKWPEPVASDEWEIVNEAVNECLRLHREIDGRVIVDFKTKDGYENDFDELKLWDDHYMQLAAYREMLRSRSVNGYESEVPYCHPLGYGGTVDFVAERMPNAVHPTTRCFIIFLDTYNAGVTKTIEAEPEGLEDGWDKFLVSLQGWKLHNNYDASY